MRLRQQQMNFTAGEWSPRLWCRGDLEKYWNAAQIMQNVVIYPHGGFTGRGGTHFVSKVKYTARKTRLIPFGFSTEQAYMLEFGHGYTRFFKDHAKIAVSNADSYTVLLLHGDGLDASTTITDSQSTPHTITSYGGLRITTQFKKWGSGSILFNGTDAYGTIPDHADFDLSGGIWTIDFQIMPPTGYLSDRTLYYHGTDANNYMTIYMHTGAAPLYTKSLVLKIVAANVIVVQSSVAYPLSTNVWNHVAFIEDGNTYTQRVGGYLADTVTATGIKPANYTGLVYLGANSTPGNFFKSSIDEFRISKDVARDMSVPPTQAYPLADENIDPLEILTLPYQEVDLAQIKYCQSADVLYLVHPNYRPPKLSRTSHVDWTLTNISFIPTTPLGTSTTSLAIATGSKSFTTQASLGYLVGDRIRAISAANSANYMEGYVTSYATTSLIVNVDLIGGTGTLADWNISPAIPDWTVAKGWPCTATFFENRLYYGGPRSFPHYIWGNNVGGGFEDFTLGTQDDDGLYFPLVSGTVNAIRWITASKYLIGGTIGGMFTISGGADSFVSPTNVKPSPESGERVADVMPLQVGNVIIFVTMSGRKLLEYVYDVNTDSHKSADLTRLAEHITEGGIIRIAFLQYPEPIIVMLRADGILIALTYLRDEDVIGAARWDVGGMVEDVAVIPSPDGTSDELWMIVKRENILENNELVTNRYIEWLDPTLKVDSGLTYSGTPTTTVSGLTHLEGKTVKIVGDGLVYPDAVVTSGAVTLVGPAASEIQVGLAYVPKVVTMRPNVNVGAGTTAGLPKKWADLFCYLLESSGLNLNGEELPFRSASDPTDEAIPLFTGEKRISNLGWNAGSVTIQQNYPLPFTVLAVYGTLETGD